MKQSEFLKRNNHYIEKAKKAIFEYNETKVQLDGINIKEQESSPVGKEIVERFNNMLYHFNAINNDITIITALSQYNEYDDLPQDHPRDNPF